MTTEELTALCRKWQERLRLRDWDIYAEVKRHWDMDLEDKNAEIMVLLPHRTAWITLRDRIDVRPEYAHLNDPEIAVVHELLHILTKPLDLPLRGPRHTAEETMLETLARALVCLERELQEKKAEDR